MTDETTTPDTEQPVSPSPEEQPASEETATAVATEEAPASEEDQSKKLQQTVDIQDIGPCKKHIKVTVDRSSIDGRLDEKYSELRIDAVVPGFRKGKAPRKVIERMYAKDVGDQVKGEILMASLEQMAEEFDVAPLSPPDLNPGKIDIPKTGPLVYEFDVEVRPEFNLPDYKGLKLKRPIKTFSDEDVAREERRLLSRYGQVVPKDGPAEMEDILIVDMTTRYNGQVIGTAKEISLRVDKRLAFKDGVAEDFGKHAVGANAGDRLTVDIKMSENVAAPNLAGLMVQAELEVKDVKQVRYPELTHEFLHNFDVHSPEQLHELIHVLLQRRLEYQQRQTARQQVMELIESQAHWELPQDLLARQARSAMSRRVMEMRDSGLNDEQINSRLRMMQQDIIRSTASSLKEHFVLQKIAEVEKIDVNEDEINAEIDRMAEENGESPRRVRARLEKEQSMDSLAAIIIERKALDLILGHAEFEDITLDQPEDEVAMTEEQAVEGEMRDPTQIPESEPADAGTEQSTEVSGG
jgi:trigger factor